METSEPPWDTKPQQATDCLALYKSWLHQGLFLQALCIHKQQQQTITQYKSLDDVTTMIHWQTGLKAYLCTIEG